MDLLDIIKSIYYEPMFSSFMYLFVISLSTGIKANYDVELSFRKKDNNIAIEADYTNLFKEIFDNIIECKIKYNYSEIDKVDKFVIIDNN